MDEAKLTKQTHYIARDRADLLAYQDPPTCICMSGHKCFGGACEKECIGSEPTHNVQIWKHNLLQRSCASPTLAFTESQQPLAQSAHKHTSSTPSGLPAARTIIPPCSMQTLPDFASKIGKVHLQGFHGDCRQLGC